MEKERQRERERERQTETDRHIGRQAEIKLELLTLFAFDWFQRMLRSFLILSPTHRSGQGHGGWSH